MTTDTFIMVGATLAAQVALWWWQRRLARQELFKELNIRDDKKKGRYVFVIGIEDFEYDREVLERILIKIGNPHSVHALERDFLEKMPTEPCVYVVDDKLHQVEGRDLHRVIMKKNPDNYFILNTGMQNDVVLAEYVKLRVDRFVYKGNIDYEKNLESAIRDGILTVANR